MRHPTEPHLETSSGPLGLIVDRSSFDEDEFYGTHLSAPDQGLLGRRALSSDCEEMSEITTAVGQGGTVMKNGRVRRKLRWKPFRRKKPSSSSNTSIQSTAERSMFSRLSFHTLHSSETPIQSNRKTDPKRPRLVRPNYPDTFEGVSTIQNESSFVHSKMMHSVDENHSLSSFDLYSASPDSGSWKQKSAKKWRPPLGGGPRDTRKCASPDLTTATTNSTRSTSSMQSSLPPENLPSLEDLEDERRVVLFTGTNDSTECEVENDNNVQTNLWSSSEPPATPRRASPERAVPAKVTIDLNTPSNLPTMMGSTVPIPQPPSTPSRNHEKRLYHPSPDRVQDGDSVYILAPENEDLDKDTLEPTHDPPTATRRWATRSGMGPVDVDDGTFLEADNNLRAIHNMAAEHLAHGEYVEALEVFEEILRGQTERYGADHYRVGTALHNIGIVHLKSGNYDKAIELSKQAVCVRKDALVPNHPDVAVSLAQLGVAYLERGSYREALVVFREALHIRKTFLGPIHPKVSKVLNNIGCALYKLEELAGAKRSFEEALEIQREMLRLMHTSSEDQVESTAHSDHLLLSIASSLCNIGSVKLRLGQIDDASILLEEALLLQQSVLGDNHPAVLKTIESIDAIERSRKADGLPSATELLSKWMDPIPLLTMRSMDAQTEASKCSGVQPVFQKMLNSNVIQSLGVVKSKRWYEEIADAPCGTVPGEEDEPLQ